MSHTLWIGGMTEKPKQYFPYLHLPSYSIFCFSIFPVYSLFSHVVIYFCIYTPWEKVFCETEYEMLNVQFVIKFNRDHVNNR